MPVTNTEHGALIDEFKNQLLIVLVKRNGGKIEIPVSEVDDTGQDILSFQVVDGKFRFEVSKKS